MLLINNYITIITMNHVMMHSQCQEDNNENSCQSQTNVDNCALTYSVIGPSFVCLQRNEQSYLLHM